MMGCQSGHYDKDNCINDIVRRIVHAQREAADDGSKGCVTSCERSIEDLLSPDRDRRPARHTTIPIMLYCRDSCKPFVGSGFVSKKRDGRRSHFECIESPIFKVRGFVKGSGNCVRLELLLPVGGRRGGEHHSHDSGPEDRSHHHHQQGSFCDKFGQRPIENFRETGLCITVDLNCFCGITCLDPITPRRA